MSKFQLNKCIAFAPALIISQFIAACGQPRAAGNSDSMRDSMLIAMTAPNGGGEQPGACLLALEFTSDGDDELGQVSNVHVIHEEGVSADSLMESQNKTIKRVITPTKESADESIPQFYDEVRTLVANSKSAGVSTNCVDAATNLAQQLEERAAAVTEVKSKSNSELGLNLGYGTVCDYDCGFTQPQIDNYNYPYNYPYQYNKYGPTWAGGYGTPDSYSNSFFRNYYGGYSSGDVLYASWGSGLANGLNRAQQVYDRANTVSTAAGGCQDNWGQRGGCVVGAGKALGADMLKGAAVNGMLRLLGAGRWIRPVGVGMAVMEPTGVADGTIEGYCRTTRIKSDPICGSFGYTYR